MSKAENNKSAKTWRGSKEGEIRGQESGQPIHLKPKELWGRFNDTVPTLQPFIQRREICGVWTQRSFPVCGQWRHQRPGLDLRVGERREGFPYREENVNKGRIELGGSGRGLRRAERALCAPSSLFHDPQAPKSYEVPAGLDQWPIQYSIFRQ